MRFMTLPESLRPAIVAILDPKGKINGTGFFVTSDGYILTCYHVILPVLKSLSPIQVQCQIGKFNAELIEHLSNDLLDFAILKIQAKTAFPCLPLGTGVGSSDTWCTLGFELAEMYHGVPNDGTIKGYTPHADDPNLRDIILTSENPILGGLSGSPIFNMKTGQVVGVIKEVMAGTQGHATSIETVFQIWHDLEKLNSSSPNLIKIPCEDILLKPLESRNPVPHGIPSPPLDFTGRDSEIKELMEHFGHGAIILGLRGMGGIGKTALAYKLAEMLQDRYSDGQLMVNLQGTDVKPMKPAAAMARIIRSLDRTTSLPEGESEISEMYQSMLHGKHFLILLDNALDDRQVRPLLPPPTCGVLVTSRKKFTLPCLKEIDLNTLKPQAARNLLHAIAGKIGDKADELAQLCGCLPLALRAAGSLLANTPDLDPAQYIEELRAERTRLVRLGSEGVDLDVEASFNLSYGRLSADTARVLRALSVFPADFDVSAEETVYGDEGHKHLSELVRWSLVEFHRDAGRYRLHDLARVFATACLDEVDGEAARIAIELKYAQYYKDVLSAADYLYLKGGDGVLAGLGLFDLEWTNIQAGQRYAEKISTQANPERKSPENELALRLCGSYANAGTYVLDMRLHPRERIRWREAALISARLLNDKSAEGAHLGNLGLAYYSLGDYHKAIELHEKHLAIAREIGDRRGEGNALSNLGLAYFNLCDYRKAIKFYEQILAIAREIGDRRGEGAAFGNLGLAYSSLGDYCKAIEFHEKHLAIAREIGDWRGEGNALGNLGNAYYSLGDYHKAIELHEMYLAIAKEIGDRRGEGAVLGNLGVAYYSLGDYRKAIELHEQALAIDKEIEDRRGEGNALSNLGLAYSSLGDYHKAIEFHEKAFVIHEEIGGRGGEGAILDNLGSAYSNLGDYRKAIEFHEQALAIDKEIGDRGGEGNALGNLGNAYFNLGDYRKAIEFHEEHLAIAREIGDRYGEGAALGNLGNAYSPPWRLL